MDDTVATKGHMAFFPFPTGVWAIDSLKLLRGGTDKEHSSLLDQSEKERNKVEGGGVFKPLVP